MRLRILGSLLILWLGLESSIRAADPAPPPAPRQASDQKAKATRYPIRGKLVAIDKAARTFSLGSSKAPRIYKVSGETKITKNGKAALLSDAVVGEDVGGYVEKQADGTLKVLSVRFGPKPASATASNPAHKQTSPK
jgi:hypothetical protein